jgi:hypothetical protein
MAEHPLAPSVGRRRHVGELVIEVIAFLSMRRRSMTATIAFPRTNSRLSRASIDSAPS